MAPRFQAPGFVQPLQYEGISNIPRTLDDIADRYMRARQFQGQQDIQAQQSAAAREQQAAMGLQYRAQFGRLPSEFSPQDIQSAMGPAPMAQLPTQQPYPSSREPQQSLFGIQQAPASTQPPQGEPPHVQKLRSYFEQSGNQKALALLDQQLGFMKTTAEIGKLEAEAGALRSGQIYFDPLSGRQITVPKGARPLPPGTGAEGKMLPPASVISLNEGKNVARVLPDVEAALNQNESLFGPIVGRIGAANPYAQQSQTVDARMRTASQAFGRFMEGGVLRKEDEEKYRKMFPQLSDTPQVATNKLAIVRRTLAQKYEDDRKTLGASGYDISGFEALQIPESIFVDQRQQVGLQPGTIKRGYRFKGGNPSDRANWEKQ